jgi:hypothetical protein
LECYNHSYYNILSYSRVLRLLTLSNTGLLRLTSRAAFCAASSFLLKYFLNCLNINSENNESVTYDDCCGSRGLRGLRGLGGLRGDIDVIENLVRGDVEIL